MFGVQQQQQNYKTYKETVEYDPFNETKYIERNQPWGNPDNSSTRKT